ncbi:alpha-ketoacid dehydrogenase [Aureococcus anophagefferens]|nr:alpha-ketoacid dehydrogenase [Aureococcus anophagefferens]
MLIGGAIARRARRATAAAANLRRNLASQAAAANAAPPAGEDVDEALRSALAFDYAKGLPFVSDLDDAWFSGRAAFPRPLPMFRLLDPEVPGALAAGAGARGDAADEFLCRRACETMVTLQALDDVFYHAQRQGRMSFYMQAAGEEAATVCSAAGLEPDDEVFGQYREQGCLLWRGFGLQAMADQCIGNVDSLDKGRVMPIHYGSKALRFQTISSSRRRSRDATGALAVKLAKEDRVVACYFGEGAASEGDAHPALNFAATLRRASCSSSRNNGSAISTPSGEQFAGDGIAPRALALGMDAIRVDGNDALATVAAVRDASAPVSDRRALVELMTA